MRGLILSSAATTPSGGHGTWPANLGSVKVGAGPAARLSVNVAPGQLTGQGKNIIITAGWWSRCASAQAAGLKGASSWGSSSAELKGARAQARKPWVASSRTMDPGQSIRDRGAWVSIKMNVLVGCLIWKPIWCGDNATLLLFVTFSSTVKNPVFSV